MEVRKYTIDPALPNTSLWLFEIPGVINWLKPLEGRDFKPSDVCLWIKGIPGSGKSVLMKEMLRRIQSTSSAMNTTVAFFFNKRSNVMLERSILGLLRSLIHQLLHQNQYLRKKVLPHYQSKRESFGAGWTWQEGELRDFLIDAVEKLWLPSITILVDALDECDTAAPADVVKIFTKLMNSAVRSGCRLKICLSSRHFPMITIPGCIEVYVENGNGADIITYVESELHLGVATEADLQQKVAAKASGRFLWLVLVVPRLTAARDKGDIHLLEEILEQSPSSPEYLFTNILSNVKDADKPQTLRLLCLVLFSYRPLNLSELYAAMRLNVGKAPVHDKEQISRFIRSRTGGLIGVSKVFVGDWLRGENQNIAHFLHETVRDFVINEGLQMLDPTGGESPAAWGHEYCVQCCIEYLKTRELLELPPKSDLQRPVSEKAICTTTVVALEEGEVRNDVEQERGEGETIEQHDSEERDRNLYQDNPSIAPPEAEQRTSQRKANNDQLGKSSRQLETENLHVRFSTFEQWSDCYPFLEYATTFLFDHARAAELHGFSQAKLVHTLDSRLFDAWLYLANLKEARLVRRAGTKLLHVASEHNIISCVEALIQSGLDVNIPGGLHGCALTDACSQGHRDLAKLLLDSGAKMDVVDTNGWTALLHAARNGTLSVSQLLIDRSANVKATAAYGWSGWTPLHAASERGHAEVAELLLHHNADIDARASGETPLYRAAKNGHHPVVRLLLEKGATVNAYGSGQDPILYCAAAGCHERVATLLLQCGAPVDHCTTKGETSLHVAAVRGFTPIAKLLLDYGARVDAKTAEGNTPLHCAAKNGHVLVAEMLLQSNPPNRADINAKNNNDETALYNSVDHWFNTPRMMWLLLKYDPDTEVRTVSGSTALLKATGKNGSNACALLLLEKGADASVTDGYGSTILYAVRYRSLKVVQRLLEEGADINARTPAGDTALILLCEQDDDVSRVAELLLDFGIEINAENRKGRTALHTAAKYRVESMIELLVKRGANTTLKDAEGKTPAESLPSWLSKANEQRLRSLFDEAEKAQRAEPLESDAQRRRSFLQKVFRK